MTFAAPKSRNDPCPCGSGRRYKACHGSDSPPAAPVAVAASADPVERARAALRNGDFAGAAAIIASDIGPQPQDHDALKVYAEALRPDDPVRSKACWERAHAQVPDDPEPLFFLGEFARDEGDFRKAIELFGQALALGPDHPAVLNNLGLAQEKTRDLAGAAASFERALAISPADTNAIANLAQNFYQQKRYKEAIPLFETLVKAMPDAPAAIWANYGVCLRHMQRLAAAIACLARATELAPDQPEPWRDLGAARMLDKQWGGAALAFARALELDPEDQVSACYLVHAGGHECVWDRYDELRAGIIDAARGPHVRSGNLPAPFPLQAISDDPMLECAVVTEWTAIEFLPASPNRPPRRHAPARLRLGFLSPDFHGHPVGRLVAGVLERLDRSRFEVRGYDTDPRPDHKLGLRIRAACDHFREMPDADQREIAAAIRADEVDVLFDLTGHTAGCNLSALALRPAPVQITWLGYTGSSGSRAIDWILTDPWCIPPERASTCVERLLYLEPCYAPCATDGIDPSIQVTRADYGLPEAAVVMAVMSAAYKITPERFEGWMEILRAVPDALLWIRHVSGVAQQRLRLRAEAAGIDHERLHFVRNEPTARYVARFRLADLFLDTHPFGSHTTVNDALSAGLPVLTEAGRNFASRASASQILAAGLPELVTASTADYVRTAIELGRDRARLRGLKDRLEANRSTQGYFDLDAFARRFEAAIERAWAETPAD